MKKVYAVIEFKNGKTETIGYSRLVSFESNNFGVSDVRTPSYGIIVPTGILEFKDANGKILSMLNNNEGDDAKVKFYLTDKENNSSTHISTFIASTWSYDNENKVVTCNLTSRFLNLQEEIVVPTKEFLDREKIEPMSLRSILFEQIISEDDFILDFSEEEDELSYMFVKYPFLEEARSKWYYIDQIAKVSARYCIVAYDENEEERLYFLITEYGE